MRQWTDPAGAVLGVQSYGPFGEVREPLGTPPWGRTSLAAGGVGRAPKGFTGEWQDPAGMVYLRARWYNVALGRFSQVDPVAGILLEPAMQHPYAYGLNNPLRFGDPSGRQVQAIMELVKQLAWRAPAWTSQLQQLGTEIFVKVAPVVQQIVDAAQVLGPKLPAWIESVQRVAQETSRRINEASQGGNTAEPGGPGCNDPNRPFRDLGEQFQYQTSGTRYGQETRLNVSVRGVDKTIDVDGIVSGFLHESKHVDASSRFYSSQIGRLGTGLQLHVRTWGSELERLSLAAEQHGYSGVKVFVDNQEAIRVAQELFGRESWFKDIQLVYQAIR